MDEERYLTSHPINTPRVGNGDELDTLDFALVEQCTVESVLIRKRRHRAGRRLRVGVRAVDNVLWECDGVHIRRRDLRRRRPGNLGGKGPAWWKQEVQEYFYQNARMYLDDYRADGLRFDATTQINGLRLRNVIGRLRDEFPSRYIVAEHLPDDPWITGEGRFAVTWCADVHHETQRALAGQDSVRKVRDVLGWDGYDHAWNLVKYALGSHDDIGDQQDGDAEGGRSTGIGAIATSSTNSAAATTGPHGRSAGWPGP
jgi:hypothetical protein